MDDMNELERQVAGQLNGFVGPVLPVDDSAIFSGITAAATSPRSRFNSMFSATKFVVAGVIVALFGGLLLAGLLTQPSEESMPVVGASMSPESTTTPRVILPSVVPDGVRAGTLDLPLGQASWVHLRGDHLTLPKGLHPIRIPSGGYVSIDEGRLWRSPDLVTWTPEPLPGGAERARVSVVDGSVWLSTNGPTAMRRSPDATAWSEVEVDGLAPGPRGPWAANLDDPLTYAGVTLWPFTFHPWRTASSFGLPPLMTPEMAQASGSGALRAGDPIREVYLREDEPGVYDVYDYRGDHHIATLRIEDTGSGLRIIDETGENPKELTVTDALSMEYIELLAGGGEGAEGRGLAILDGDRLVKVDLPDAMRAAEQAQFSVDQTGFLAHSLAPDGLLRIHRSEDGRDWTQTGVVGDDPGEPTDLEYFGAESGGMVVGTDMQRWISTDGVSWEPWHEDEDDGHEGIDFASGRIEILWEDDTEGRLASVDMTDVTLRYVPESGPPVPIDVSELSLAGSSRSPDGTIDVGGGGGGALGSNGLVFSEYEETSDGSRVTSVWIIAFDDLADAAAPAE